MPLFGKPKYKVLGRINGTWEELGYLEEKPSIAVIRSYFPDIDEEYEAVRVVDNKGRTIYHYIFKKKKKNKGDKNIIESLKELKELKEALRELEGDQLDPLSGMAFTFSTIVSIINFFNKYPALKTLVCGGSGGGASDLEEFIRIITALRGMIPQMPQHQHNTQVSQDLRQPHITPTPEALELAKKVIEDSIEEVSDNVIKKPCEVLEECVGGDESA
ncbi:MAG: hypothetical protein GSR72_00245 [Desulfurococcales archaeon]|nr:hypothetical protein [Desulfurococcales archaeon]